MAERRWIHHCLRLGLVGVRRRLRSIRWDRSRKRLLGVSVAGFVFVFVGMGLLFAYGLRSAATPIGIPSSIRIGLTGAWLFGVWYISQRVLLYYRRLDSEAFVLTTVSARTAVGSLLLTDFISTCILLALPTVTAIGVVGYAFGDIVSVVMIPLTTALFAATVTVTGSVIGFGYLHLAARSRTIERYNYSILIRVLVVIVVVAMLTNGFLPSVELPALGTFEWVPTGWFADLAALGTPSDASLAGAAGSIVASFGVITVGISLTSRLAAKFWYGDAGTDVNATTHRTTDSVEEARLDKRDVLADSLTPLWVPEVISRPVRSIAQVGLLRLRRAPRRISFLLGPVLSIAIVLLVEAGDPWRLMPVTLAVGIPWFAGACLGLNPLGNEGAVLPVTLTSISGSRFIRGVMVPGILYGIPVATVFPFVTALIGPYSPFEAVGFAVVGAFLTAFAVVFAPAVGVRLPRFSSLIVGERDGAILPSLAALALYSLVIGALGRLTTITLIGSSTMDRLLRLDGISPTVFHALGTVSIVIIGTVGGYIAYRSAANRFATYRYD